MSTVAATADAPLTASNAEWISCGEAKALLGVSYVTLKKLTRQGHLTMQKLPVGLPRYLKADVVRLLEQSTTRATATAGAE